MVKKENLLCEAHILSRQNSVGEDIVEFAKQMNAAYIVMGIRRRSQMEKIVFGSIAQYVVLHSPCPVTTVG
jgi:nucleotide-binding universal stress UspA family protein